MELDRPRLAFVHIEKCGGTTLRGMLETQWAPDRICPERHDGLGHWTINELAAYDLFAGHFDLALCRSIPGRVRTVTLLREPRARLRSLYRFWKAHLPHPERDKHNLMALVRALPEAAFFAHEEVRHHPSIRNAMAAQLTRTGQRDTLRQDDRLVADPRGSLVLAWDRLRRMDCFGIVERFEESRLMMNARLGLAMPAMAPRQVLAELVAASADMVEVEAAPPSPQLDALLAGLTDVDVPLYAMAGRLFGERLRHVGLAA
jgi:hypothetical protein